MAENDLLDKVEKEPGRYNHPFFRFTAQPSELGVVLAIIIVLLNSR